MAITFFKTPRNKQFNYKPVYWDKKKEEREKRLRSAMDEVSDTKSYADALRERMEMRWKRTSGARTRKSSNLRLVAVFAALVLVFYYLFLR
jgi:type VI protein secretion system component VasF